MFVKSFLVLYSALAMASAFAQESLGTVGNVQGLVTVIDGASGGTVSPGAPITEGMRFMTTSSGSATLQLNNGCTLTLQPGQAVTVHDRMTCPALVAAVENLDGVAVLAGAGGSAGKGILAVGALAAGGFALHRVLDSNPNLSGR